MRFGTGKYAKIWELKKGNGNYYTAEMSTSKKAKDKNGNEIIENGKTKYETDWSDKFVRLVGEAARAAEGLSAGSSVKIGNCEVTNKYDKEKKVTYTNYVIFSFEDNNSSRNTYSKSSTGGGFMNIPDGVEDDDLPFN